MSDPIVSVPTAIGEKPAATETAEPVDDPPGFYRAVRSDTEKLDSLDYAVATIAVILAETAFHVCRLCLTTHPRPARIGKIGS